MLLHSVTRQMQNILFKPCYHYVQILYETSSTEPEVRNTVFTLYSRLYNHLCNWLYNRLYSVNAVIESNTFNSFGRLYNWLYNQLDGWMNYANEPSQAALEPAPGRLWLVIASQQDGCVDSRWRGGFDPCIFKRFWPAGCTTGCIVYTDLNVSHQTRTEPQP